MAATASAAPVAFGFDTSAGDGYTASSRSILSFLQLPRELRDQVRLQAAATATAKTTATKTIS